MKKLSFIIVLLLLIGGGVLAWIINGSMPVDASDKTSKTFTVRKGEGIREIANDLKSQDLIRDPVVFFLVVRSHGLDEKIQAGDFYLSPAMNALDTAKALQVGTNDLRITIPEGKRADEIADILKENLPGYDETWRTQLNQYEGYLFPDTYSFPKDATIDQIIEAMRNNFEKKYLTINGTQNSKFTKAQIVNIAAMVEREAKHDEDRPMVASVIINRLNAGMAIDIDATIQYAIGTPKDWWPELTDSGKNIVPASVYNSYTHVGLPPGPISNPGLNVLNAVVNPANTDYLFYLSDSKGNNHYAKTNAEHEANKKKYGL